MTDSVPLGPAGLLRLQGADARSFAHAQFCSDVAGLPGGDWQWSAWLDARGRVRFFFALIDAGPDHLLAWLPLGDATAFATELRRFLFRARLKIDTVEGWVVRGRFAAPDGAARLERTGDGFALRLDGSKPRLVELVPGDAVEADREALRRWRGCDVADGLPLIDAACADEFVPQALDLERFGAISFRKGCYPGQEIAARLHFRGGNKRHPRRLRWNGDDGSVVPGLEVRRTDSGEGIGRLLYRGVDSIGEVGLAVLSDGAGEDVPLALGDAVAVRDISV